MDFRGGDNTQKFVRMRHAYTQVLMAKIEKFTDNEQSIVKRHQKAIYLSVFRDFSGDLQIEPLF